MTRLFALSVALAPALVLACPVCGQGREGSGTALLVMSIIMTMLPLLLIGSVVLWIYLRVKKAEREAALLPNVQPEPK
jgi:hypothetical protein